MNEFGSLAKLLLPVEVRRDPVKMDEMIHHTKLDGEFEDCYTFGDALMYSGVNLKQAFAGNGFNGDTRFYQDFASRIYFMEVEEGE